MTYTNNIALINRGSKKMSNLESKMDDIYISMCKDKHKKAVKQLKKLGLENAPYVFDYIAYQLGQPEAALELARQFFIVEYSEYA